MTVNMHDQDTILFTAAFRTSKPHSSNLIEIHNIKRTYTAD